jgi:hypothetical protein
MTQDAPKTALEEATSQDKVVPQATLDQELPGHVPNAAEVAGTGPSPWLKAAQAADATAGLAQTPPADLYFTFTRPDGDSFLAPASSAEQYLRKGYTVTGEQRITDSNQFRDVVSPGSLAPAASGVPEATDSTSTSSTPTTSTSKTSTTSKTSSTSADAPSA